MNKKNPSKKKSGVWLTC